ncbi:MAG TPA: hypothetical protein VMT34_14505 [Aggregatilineales bacterium]|nr:hypothetical protein [Aggregatilineales bacterium]
MNDAFDRAEYEALLSDMLRANFLSASEARNRLSLYLVVLQAFEGQPEMQRQLHNHAVSTLCIAYHTMLTSWKDQADEPGSKHP